MTAIWPAVPLGEVLHRSERIITLDPESIYKEVTVRMHGKGVVERRTVQGVEIASHRRYEARAGQFIISRIDARHGASGLVPENLDGAVVTNDFPLFDVASQRLDPSFLSWMSKTASFVELCKRASEGTTNRVRLSEDRFKSLEIRLPRPQEQRRIVGRIERLAAKVRLAQALRSETTQSVLAIPRSILRSDDDQRSVRLRDLVQLRAPDVAVQPDQEYQFAGVYSFGRGVFPSVRKMGSDFSYSKLTRVREGEFIYPKLMAWEGAVGVVPAKCDGMFVSPEFPVFEIDRTAVAPEVLDVHFRSPEVWPSLSGQSGGTNVRRRRLHPDDFLNLEIRLPSKATQARLVDVVRRLANVSQLQVETTAELDAMVPAILDRAFKGEL